jgi:hypothetical protein
MTKLENLDPKISINFLNNIGDDIDSNAMQIKINPNNVIWQIDDFLLEDECNQIISSSELNHFTKLEYRDVERLLCFDKNENLIKTIEKRLNGDSLLDRLNKKLWKEPYGFNLDVTWQKNGNRINNCLRINKYTNTQSFKWHRDAQYTESPLIKSNYTIIIYLNDNFENGETIFRVPNNEIEHNGLTVDQELEKMIDYNDIIIKPKKGTAIIFDQRLLHMANSVINTKYVLRTDLICVANKTENYSTELVNKLNVLTKKLFRQAQYYELENINQKECNELYEICLSLRQNPYKITNYPQYLEDLLIDINIDNKILSNLRLISINGQEHKYKFKSNYKFIMVKISAIYTILCKTESRFSIDNFNKFKKILSIVGLDTYINKYNLDEIGDDYEEDDENEENDEENEENDEENDEENNEENNNKEDEKNTAINKNLIEIKESIKELSKIRIFFSFNNSKKYDIIMTKIKNQIKYLLLNYNLNSSDLANLLGILNGHIDIDGLEQLCLNNVDSNNLKELICSQPLSVNVEVDYQNYGYDCDGCSLCDTECFNNENDKKFYYNLKHKLKIDDFEIQLNNIKIINNIYTGKINVCTPSQSFNHASCNCERHMVFGDKGKLYQTITFEMDFKIKSNIITINIVPNVVL